ncbi:MAG: FtsW/RodA/SpoVE family cell cycle protein, partial [Gemmatimonadaceae bacterium]|nr:FtsW/RodA/SpoVE family cell cycle protein [Gemmatimonadaceae bacterium]
MGATIARPGVPVRERVDAQVRTDRRVRWRMGRESRGLTLITFALLCFGLAVLYSSSAILAMNDGQPSTYYLVRQLAGAVAGLLAFAIAAKSDAERWHGWAWPLMWFTIATMVLTLVLPESVAPRINGSKRFLFGASFQPSELGKLAVVVWCAMLVIKKGETLRRLTKGLLPFLLVIALLCVLAALQPDLSVAMLYTLLMGVVLFAGGARMGHFVALTALAFPLLWSQIEKVHYALLRLSSFLDPGAAPREVSYQLEQSLIAVGSGGLLGQGFGEGRQQLGFLPYPYSDFIASNIGEEWGFIGLAAVTIAFGAYALLGFRIARAARS